MKHIVLVLMILQSIFIYSQHSERFKTLIDKIKPGDTSYVVNYYKDSVLKVKGTKFYYNRPEYNYSKKASQWKAYYKNGMLKSESEYDKLGNLLNKTLYNMDGTKSSEMTATSIDSDLLDPKDYFLRNDEIVITFKIKNYKFSKTLGETYLREFGNSVGGKRVGIWKLYTESGMLDKEINYDKN